MQANSWHDLSQLYIERGFSVIPVSGKVPQIENWQRWCSELIENPVVTSSQTGIGLCLGPASNLVAVDIDTDDAKILDLVPPSPVVRRGKKGEVRFFQYSKDIQSRTYRMWAIEILSVGRQVVLPPSIHPDTKKPYEWTKSSLLDFDLDMLPTLDLSFVERMGDVRAPIQTVGGRHNKLKDIAVHMICRGEPLEFVAKEIYEQDRDFHNPRWFTDPSEIWKAKSEAEAQRAAMIFVTRLCTSLLNLDVYQPILNFQAITGETEHEKQPIKAFELKQYPEPQGILKHFTDLIIESSYTDVPNMALGSAISIFSVLLGNRFVFEDVKANVFTLLLADSGTGKKFGINVARQLLSDVGFLGSADYLSSSAIATSLSDYCTRLDTSDEFSKLLKLSKEGNAFQLAIPQDLCRLWSASVDGFDLPIVKKDKDDKDEKSHRIESPFISILSATTLSEFKECISKSAFTSGFVPRFLLFMDQPNKNIKNRLNVEKIKPLKERCLRLAKEFKGSHMPNPITGAISAAQYVVDSDAEVIFEEKMQGYHVAAIEEPNEMVKPIITRSREQMKKLALIHAASRLDPEQKIKRVDIEWACEVISISMHNASLFLTEAATENVYHSNKERFLGIIKMHPNITQAELTKQSQFFKKRERDTVIQDLLESERIGYREQKNSKNGKTVKTFFAI